MNYYRWIGLGLAFCLLLVSVHPQRLYAQPPTPPAPPASFGEHEEAPPSLAQNDVPSVDSFSSDELFDSQGGNLKSYLGRRQLPNGRYSFMIDIDRWFSPLITGGGAPSEAVTAELVRRKILPETATLVMGIFDVDHENTTCPEVDHVYINGQQLMTESGPAFLTSGNNTRNVVSFEVPTRMLIFAADPGPTGKPSAQNKVELDVNVLGCGIGRPGTQWQVQVDWATLALQAPVRPVVLVHGWNSSPATFSEGDNFVGLLRDLGMPFAEPVNYEGGIVPLPRGMTLLRNEVAAVRQRFGVEKVNLIGHSRGGLIARLALEDRAFAQQVESLVTLGSPHHGTSYGSTPTFTLDAATLRSLAEMSKDHIRDTYNYNCVRPSLLSFEQTCEPRYVRASGVRYYSIAEGARQSGALVVSDREATFPWAADKAPFPTQGNVDQLFTNLNHGELARIRVVHCQALQYIAAEVAAVGGCGPAPQLNAPTGGERTQQAAEPELAWISDAPSYAPDASVTLQAAVVQNGAVVSGSSVTGQLLVPGADPVSLLFADRGADGDQVAGDGIFTARLTAPAGGLHALALQGSAGGSNVQALGALLVGTPTASFLTAQTPRVVDSNRNQLFDELQIPIRVQVSRAGHFRAVARLTTRDGQPVAETVYSTRLRGAAGLAAGAQTLTMSFDGRQIRQRGLAGPYVLASVAIYDESDVMLPVALVRPGANTSTYTPDQFEGALFTFAEGRSTTEDTDNDGLFDRLQVSLRFTVAVPGAYRWSGRIIDPRGVEVGWASGIGTLNTATPLTLTFDGRRVGNRYLDGPYTVRDLAISSSSVQLVLKDVFTTSPYQASQFERDPRRLYLPDVVR